MVLVRIIFTAVIHRTQAVALCAWSPSCSARDTVLAEPVGVRGKCARCLPGMEVNSNRTSCGCPDGTYDSLQPFAPLGTIARDLIEHAA